MSKVVGTEFWRNRLIKAMEPIDDRGISKLRKLYDVPSGLSRQETVGLIADKILSKGVLARFLALVIINNLRND